MQKCMLLKEREKAIKTSTDWIQKEDGLLSVFTSNCSSLDLPSCVGHRREPSVRKLTHANLDRTSKSPLGGAGPSVSLAHTSKMSEEDTKQRIQTCDDGRFRPCKGGLFPWASQRAEGWWREQLVQRWNSV